MNKKILALLLGACLIFALAGCSVSHSSSSTSTVSSTVNGETTTTTTTTENGETHTETTTTTADGNTTTTVDGQVVESSESAPAEAADPNDPTGLRAKWHDTFTGGAEGTNDDGEHFYFIFDNPDSLGLAAMMITSADGKTLSVYDYGKVLKDENDKPYIEDVEGSNTLPFEIVETNDNGFVFGFQNGVQTQFNFVDLDTIINDMITIWEGVQNGSIAYSA